MGEDIEYIPITTANAVEAVLNGAWLYQAEIPDFRALIKGVQEKVASAGGRLLSAAFSFLGEMLPPQEETDGSRQTAAIVKQRFAECMEKDEEGRLKLTVTLPDASALDGLADSLARLLAYTGSQPPPASR